MIKIKRGSDERSVKESRIQEYIDAGWQRVEGEEVIRLRPPAKFSKAAVDKTALEANKPQGE
jgi:hypothetical protein